MRHREFELTAYCGLYCGDCIRYNGKVVDLAAELWHELQRAQFEKYAAVKSKSAKELEGYGSCCKVLEAIAKLKCVSPCRLGGNGCASPCPIKKCVQSRGMQGCWQCHEMERCAKFEFLRPFHDDNPRENLRKVQKYGLARWATHRGKFYPWLK
jgi:hypothetical protein